MPPPMLIRERSSRLIREGSFRIQEAFRNTLQPSRRGQRKTLQRRKPTEVCRSSSMHALRLSQREDDTLWNDSSEALSLSSIQFDELGDDTVALVVQAWNKCKSLADQQMIGMLIVEKLQEIEPEKSCEILRLENTKADVFLHQMSMHMRAVRIANFVQDLFAVVEKDGKEFKIMMRTFWRQQHGMGWTLQMSHLTAFTAAITRAVGQTIGEEEF
eukprot:CAMPEP_0198139034 /NCGR_PEP_ID=MMETSP1443-20131203/2374_1 /TAXON_ID=186043 /ORGANISM="Entomoneis sp., Strain CCMP2396" /LENGTH=214 /DNA_ID=CAMNT_0043801017 /DNA_START=45 /DNA_END=686 /DNA_ORIENTATION=-